MKRCSRCDTEKPLTDFRNNSKAKDGLAYWCRQCFREYDAERYKNGDNERINRNKAAGRKRKREYVKAYLKNNPCVDCGDSDWWNLDFDHRDRELKRMDVCSAIHNLGMDNLIKEIDKCDVRCTKCHRRKTIDQMGWWRSVD